MENERFTSMFYCEQAKRPIFVERIGHPLEKIRKEGILCKEAYFERGRVMCNNEECKIYEKLK